MTMTAPFVRFLTLSAALLASPACAWVPPSSSGPSIGFQKSQTSKTSIYPPATSLSALLDPSEAYEAADTSFLSASDVARLSKMRSRHVTMPLMIHDAMLPGQRLEFGSPDTKFHRLMQAVLSSGDEMEIGMVGFNPHTGRPLNMGVTMKLRPDAITIHPETQVMTISAQATRRRFEVQGEPWMDDTDSFYFANVELVEDRPEAELSEELQEQADVLMEALPGLVEEWLQWVLKSGKSTVQSMAERMEDIGILPDTMTDRAIWAAGLVNPIPPLGVCLEVRPAMLACKNDFDRLYLASAALQSSIDHMSGKKRLF